MADDWWAHQKGLRQTLRTEVAVGRKAPDAQLDQWAITIRYEEERIFDGCTCDEPGGGLLKKAASIQA